MAKVKHSKKEREYRMTPELEKFIAKVEEDIKNSRNIIGPFRTAKEFDKYLDSL